MCSTPSFSGGAVSWPMARSTCSEKPLKSVSASACSSRFSADSRLSAPSMCLWHTRGKRGSDLPSQCSGLELATHCHMNGQGLGQSAPQ
eukprot:scaffold55546_cov69-Phaeocystis_antarctica.AAC.1